jgi:hypothetical protein
VVARFVVRPDQKEAAIQLTTHAIQTIWKIWFG